MLMNPQATLVLLSVLQLGLVIEHSSLPSPSPKATIAASVIALLSTVILCPLSLLEHGRTPRPSSMTSAFLFVTLLCDIIRLHTAWTSYAESAITELLTAAIVARGLAFVLEVLEKPRHLDSSYRGHPPEATSGLFSRSLLIWLNKLLIDGAHNILAVEDLWPGDEMLSSARILERFLEGWEPGE